MTDRKPLADTDLSGDAAGVVLSAMWDDDGPGFREPWEAHAFAMAVHLHEQGVFSWAEWADVLGVEIKRAQAADDPDTGETYCRHWLATLEAIVVRVGLTDAASLRDYYNAWNRAVRRTPHGSPIELHAEDHG